jgi:hypothetical protein
MSNDIHICNLTTLTWRVLNVVGDKPAPRFGQVRLKKCCFIVLFLPFLTLHLYLRVVDDGGKPDRKSVCLRRHRWLVWGSCSICLYIEITFRVWSLLYTSTGRSIVGSKFFNDMWKLDLNSKRWMQILSNQNAPSPRSASTDDAISGGA